MEKQREVERMMCAVSAVILFVCLLFVFHPKQKNKETGPAESTESAEEVLTDEFDIFEETSLPDPYSKNEVKVYQFRDTETTMYKDDQVSKLMTAKDGVMVSYMLKIANDPEKQVYASISDYMAQSTDPSECILSEGTFLNGSYAKAITDKTMPEPVSIVFAAKKTSQNSCLVTRVVLSSGFNKDEAQAFFDINDIKCPENAISLGTTEKTAAEKTGTGTLEAETELMGAAHEA